LKQAARNHLPHVILHDPRTNDDIAQVQVGLAGGSATDTDHQGSANARKTSLQVCRDDCSVVRSVPSRQARHDDVVLVDASEHVDVVVAGLVGWQWVFLV
jgi:hypothetical protein